jgi:DNA-binding NarL/FixJ family response regulator
VGNIAASVLVIEGHPMMRAALCAAIAEETDLRIGMQAGSIAQALQMAATLLPEIILLTMEGTDRNCLEALTVLHKTLPGVPILALVGGGTPGQEQAVLNAGARVVLTRAASRADLLRALRSLTGANGSEGDSRQEADQTSQQTHG